MPRTGLRGELDLQEVTGSSSTDRVLGERTGAPRRSHLGEEGKEVWPELPSMRVSREAARGWARAGGAEDSSLLKLPRPSLRSRLTSRLLLAGSCRSTEPEWEAPMLE